MLAANNDEDVYLRHAGALALARIGLAEPIVALSAHPSRGVRIAAVVALRRMKDAGVARFLADQDEFIVTEAARAINDDGGIDGALPALAAALEGKVDERGVRAPRDQREPPRRHARGGAARRGVRRPARRDRRAARRSDRRTLGVWPKPSILDRVDGYSNIGPVQHDTGKVVGVATRDTARPAPHSRRS